MIVTFVSHIKKLRNAKRAEKYLKTAEHLFQERKEFQRVKLIQQICNSSDLPLDKNKAAEDWLKEGLRLQQLGLNQGAVDAYKKAYTEMSNNKARKKATILLKQERVMKEIEKSVLDVAKGLGIDHEYILGKLKNLADYSEDDNIILQSAKELGKIVGTSGTTVKQREVGLLGVFQGFSPDEIEGAAREQKQITAKSESE